MFPFSHGASREEIAAYLLANGDFIRRRVIGKLRAAGVTDAFHLDADDVTSSVVRRLDRAAARGLLRTESEREVWAYIGVIVDNLVHDRVAAARQQVIHLAQLQPPSGMTNADPERLDLGPALDSFENSGDRELLLLRLRGAPYDVIS